jgi:hypothetical protein
MAFTRFLMAGLTLIASMQIRHRKMTVLPKTMMSAPQTQKAMAPSDDEDLFSFSKTPFDLVDTLEDE